MRKLLAVVIAASSALLLTSCSQPSLFGGGVACAQWVGYESDEQRADDADLIVVVDDVQPDGTTMILGYSANAYLVRVSALEKGSLDDGVGARVRVGSTADSCSDSPYGEDGDQMLQDVPLRLYLNAGEGGWETLTPFDGAQPAR